MKSERGSVTVLAFVTVMFILIILATLFYSTVEKSKSQVIEMEKLSNALDGDMGEIYKERKSAERIYVTLYSDGGLVFTNSNKKITGREVAIEYGDISNLNSTETVPWASNKLTINKAEFKDKISPKTTTSWFSGCTNLVTLEQIDNLDTSNVTNMTNMFYNCEKLISLDLSNFNTSNVTNMGGFLGGCTKLTNLNLKNFNLSKAITYNEFIPNLDQSAVIRTNQIMADWLKTNYPGVDANIQII